MNQKALQILEFDKVIQLLAKQATSSAGREKCLALLPSSDPEEIRQAQQDGTKDWGQGKETVQDKKGQEHGVFVPIPHALPQEAADPAPAFWPVRAFYSAHTPQTPSIRQVGKPWSFSPGRTRGAYA